MSILIISHTEHYFNENGKIVGLGPTVREIDFLAEKFGSVVHVACLYKSVKAPASAKEYDSSNVRFVPIPPYGGSGLRKLNIFTTAPQIIYSVIKELKKADFFQFRAPTTMGVYLIPILSLFSKKKGWYKYAGNWMQKNGPLSYRFQKWFLLKLQHRKITINGHWPGQPANCLTFENPCIDKTEREEGATTVRTKNYEGPFEMCFVGRIESEKGVGRILAALKDSRIAEAIARINIVGDGSSRREMEGISKKLPIEIIFHGSLSHEKVFEIYKRSHFLIFPSDSEGFPKVVAEACNFGCIPIVSDVSSISQYVTKNAGFLWKPGEGSFQGFFNNLDLSDPNELKKKALLGYEIADQFTFERYLNKLDENILN